MSTRDEDTLVRLAQAVAEGTPVDWAREAAAQPELRPQLEKLRALEGIAALNAPAAPDPPLGREAATLPKGSRFEDRYEILGELGSGSFGRVYQARQLSTGQSVAIKLLSPRKRTDESSGREADRFRRETRICAELSHTNIVGLIDSGETPEGQLYAVFEHVPGETLQQALARDGALGVRESVRLMTQVLDAVACAHAKGIVHRDLKPANLMLSGTGARRNALVLDFGVGGLAEGRQRQEWQTLTQTREFVGTPLYASPEQLAGAPATPRSDLYAWGLIFLECLTGPHPFAEKGAAARLLAAGGEVEIPGWLADHRLGALLATMTAHDSERRDVTAEGLIETLEEIAGGELPVAPGTPPPSTRPAERDERGSSPSGPERRLSAIVSADVVGYSRLMADDEDSTVRTVEAYREEIELHVRQHRGEMQFTGDNFLAEFGSAVEAVRFASEVQRVLQARNAELPAERRMEFRMGIHLGDVRVEGERLFGTGVNIAARLEGLAAPGGLCISGTVREQLRGTLDLALDDLGEQQVKNIPDPVHAYRVRVDGSAPSARRPRTTARHWVAGAGALVLLLGVAVAIWRSLEPAAPGSAMDTVSLDSLAVLPFVNMSADPDQEYFADGIAEELLNTVARFEGLRVVGRTSSFSFRNSDADLKTIGEALGADVILEGSVRTAGNRVRITAQLVDSADGYQRWSETYERELDDIFAIQTEIATAIATALRVRLSSEQRDRLATVQTENLAAYRAYLLGNQRLAKFTIATREEAIGYLQQAIELDPKFAPAYTSLAIGYLEHSEDSDLPPDEMLARAQVAADKALELDDRFAEAHVAVGSVKYFENDFEAAEAAFQRALALNPNSVLGNLLYGDLLGQYLARYEESLALRRKAVELDPLSLQTVPRLGNSFEWLGRFDEALAWYERALEIDPDFSWGHSLIGTYHWYVSGRLDEAVVWSAKAVALDPSPALLADHGRLLLDLGDPVEAGDWIQRSIEQGPENPYANFAMQLLELYRGDEAAALEHGRKAFALHPFDVLSSLRDHEVRAGRYAEARALYEELFPELLDEPDPEVDFRNYPAAINLALILSRTGEQDRADWLLDRSLQQIQRRPRLGVFGYGLSDVQIHALRGEKQQALSALRHAIDEGWRVEWWYQLRHKPDLEPLHDEPEFQAMLQEIEADMAAQLERVREMERRGELTFPAGPVAGPGSRPGVEVPEPACLAARAVYSWTETWRFAQALTSQPPMNVFSCS